LIKRDPHFSYSSVTVTPVVSTEALVREAQDYLQEEIFPTSELHKLNFPRRPIDPRVSYWLAWKEVAPFSPLLSVEAQNDVHRRTVLAQRGHFAELEFSDDNPVGMPVGILVAEGKLDAIRQHVESCEVFPDTLVTYTELLPLPRVWQHTISELRELRRPASDVQTPEWVLNELQRVPEE
jgi:hypothetical protein